MNRLSLEVKQDSNHGRALHFPFMSISDMHWGTMYSRGKRLCKLLEHTLCDILEINGDAVDGEILLQRKKWLFPEWHRQGLAHLLRKAAEGTKVFYHPGNHEKGLRGEEYEAHGHIRQEPSLVGRTVYGVNIVEERIYTDPQGRRLLILHGDKYDDCVFKSPESKEFWYRVGSALNDGIYQADAFFRNNPWTEKLAERFSIASTAKKAVKVIINGKLGVRAAMARAIDAYDYDGAIYGHSHMGGFQITPQGKILMNDGCCTDHVQALVHDKNGVWALTEWHRDRLDIEQEDGQKYSVPWKDIGMQSFRAPATLFADRHTNRVDKLIEGIRRRWPPRGDVPQPEQPEYQPEREPVLSSLEAA